MESTVVNFLGYPGVMLSMSKSNYRNSHPNNLVVFNGNVCVIDKKVWFGDIDITISKNILLELSKELNQSLYILSEMDGRFDNEDKPKIENFLAKFNPDGTYELHSRIKDLFSI